MGLVEAADGGTLFLDEINSLPLSIQGKILRTLEEKSIQRVGSTKTKKVDFRLIAATNFVCISFIISASSIICRKTFQSKCWKR